MFGRMLNSRRWELFNGACSGELIALSYLVDRTTLIGCGDRIAPGVTNRPAYDFARSITTAHRRLLYEGDVMGRKGCDGRTHGRLRKEFSNTAAIFDRCQNVTYIHVGSNPPPVAATAHRPWCT